MKDIFTIIFRLTLTCVVAGMIMGLCFIVTNKAKQHNEHANEQKVMYGLLGYGGGQSAPASLKLQGIYRYLVNENDVTSLGYLVPLADGGSDAFSFVTIDLDGNFLARKDLQLSSENAVQEKERHGVIQAALGADVSVRFADQTIFATENGSRLAYLLPGEFPGFKTFVKVMMALDQDFTIIGLEIMEHEEDPGLGGEIVQDYFKNQFCGKTSDTLKKLSVVKVPLPEEYRTALEADETGSLGPEEVARIQEQYKDRDIYALTGATISSASVTNGVKGIVKKFVYRIAILDRVLAEQQIGVSF